MGYSAVKLDLPVLLRPGQQPGAGHRQRRKRRVQHRAQPGARSIARPSRPRARHGRRGAAERRRAARDARDAAGRPRRPTPPDRRREDLARVDRDGAGAPYYAERALHVPFAGDALPAQAVRVFGAISIGMGVLAVCAHLLRIEEFAAGLRRRVLRYLNVVDSDRNAPLSVARTLDSSFSFGPGPLSPAIKVLIVTNVALFLLMWLMPAGLRQAVQEFLGLVPAAIFESLRVWQPVTYMFLHDGRIGHILFNMLALWMFGTELERMWGTKAFLRYYFVTGIAAAITTILVSLLPFPATAPDVRHVTIGASGAIYGLLLAYGLTFPNRPIYMYSSSPIPAKYFVMIMGAIALFSSMGDSGGGIAHITHLGGLVAGYVMLRGGRLSPGERSALSLPAMEDGPRAEEVRRVLRRGRRTGTSTYTEKEKSRSASIRFSFFVFPFASLPPDHQRQQDHQPAEARSRPSDRRTGTSSRRRAGGSTRQRAQRPRPSSSRSRA